MKQFVSKNSVFHIFLALVLLSSTVAAQTSNLGIFETSSDIGTCSVKGSSAYNPVSQEYTIAGSGTNIWYGKDAFHYLYKKMKGDFILQFEFSFIGKVASPHCKVGWMVRNDTTSNSATIDGTVHDDGLTSIQYRLDKGATMMELKSTAKAPNIIQLERRGNTYILSTAVKGQDFTSIQFTDTTKRILNEALVGMFICSHEKNIKESALIRNVRITIPAKPDFRPYRDYLGSNLEVMDIETGSRKIVYTAPGSIQAPNWTVNGKSLIYNGGGKMYNFDLKKGIPTEIDTKFAVKNNNDHVLSFDGKLLGLSDASEKGTSQVYIVPVKGGTPQLITSRLPSYLHGFSTDAKTMIYTGDIGGDYELFAIDIKTKQETRLTNSPGLDDGSEYSPDGKYIYFNSVRSGKMQIWRMKPDGTNPERITNDESNNWFPHVSPNGKWIAYVAFGNDVKPDEHPFYRHVSIRLMNIETKEVKILAHIYGGQGSMNTPSWSPDSKKIAFITNTGLNDWFKITY